MGLIIEASAPGRCGIVGNPSDIYGGVVVSCSLPNRAVCRLIDDGEGRRPEDLTLWRAATARYPVDESLSVEWSTTVPRSSGLAGSTALLAATLACVFAARGEAPDLSTPEGRSDFAEIVRDVERYEAGVMCGYQDAYMVVHGNLNRLNFAGKHPVERGPRGTVDSLSGPLPLATDDCAVGGGRVGDGGSRSPNTEHLPFLLITTGVQRLSGSVHGPMADRWLAGEPLVVDSMNRLREMGLAGADAVERGDWDALADLMNENQRIIASLGGSGDVIDDLINRCLAHGARAAKLAGAGMGGTVIAMTENPDELQAALSAEGFSRFIRPEPTVGLTLSI